MSSLVPISNTNTLSRWNDPDIWDFTKSGAGDLTNFVNDALRNPFGASIVPFRGAASNALNRVTRPLAPILSMDLIEKENEFVVQVSTYIDQVSSVVLQTCCILFPLIG